MVLIEVDRDFEGFDRLLGAHAWSSFLKHPSAEESGMTSKIFFSTYRSGREVQKHGWKRVDIRNEWFRREPPENL
ncbi:hypothetical protein OF83DRAFT_1068041 [Amylostereum chailletii]|nr:hypothetical protein OF83DRAFT_1068041 [Amylostereum chailletii]